MKYKTYKNKPTKYQKKLWNKIKAIFLVVFFVAVSIDIFTGHQQIKEVKEDIQEVKVMVGEVEMVKVDNIARVTCYTDKGIMANGSYVYPGAVAFSDRTVALNQDIYVEVFGEMFIADRTAKWVHEKYDVPTIDIWMTEEECEAFGMKYLSYKIMNKIIIK